MEGTRSAIRMSGRVIVIIGLAIFYGSIFLAFAAGFEPPPALSKAAMIVPAVGCVILVAWLSRRRAHRTKMWVEATLGVLCLPPGLVGLFLTYGEDPEQMQVFWLVVTIFLLPGAIALIVLSARAWGAAKRWQNSSSVG